MLSRPPVQPFFIVPESADWAWACLSHGSLGEAHRRSSWDENIRCCTSRLATFSTDQSIGIPIQTVLLSTSASTAARQARRWMGSSLLGRSCQSRSSRYLRAALAARTRASGPGKFPSGPPASFKTSEDLQTRIAAGSSPRQMLLGSALIG
jgi:hypothetical protein